MQDVPARRRFLFLVASTRRDGNSERLARRAATALPPHAESRWIRLDEHTMPPFVDTRHDVGYQPPEGAAATLAQATLWATDLVFVTPVYWYSLPATAKAYLDHWSAWMRVADLKFKESMKGRTLWAIVVDSSDPGDGSADPLIGTLEKTADYMAMRWAGVLLGHANKPGEIEQDEVTWRDAVTFFARREAGDATGS